MHYHVDEHTKLTAAGDIRAMGPGDRVSVWRSATRRDDWAPLAGALMTAFARGADLVFADDTETKE